MSDRWRDTLVWLAPVSPTIAETCRSVSQIECRILSRVGSARSPKYRATAVNTGSRSAFAGSVEAGRVRSLGGMVMVDCGALSEAYDYMLIYQERSI